MEITCPNCKFSREVADEKIPPNSVMATCPKCKHRFRFKELDFTLEESDDPAASVTEESDASAGADIPSNGDRPEDSDIPPQYSRTQDRTRSEGAYGFQAEDRFGPGPDMEPPPWERLHEFGFFSGLTRTVKLAMLHPVRFFSSMPVGVGLGKPLVFYLLVGEFQAVCQMLWQLLGMNAVITMTGGREAVGVGMTGMAPIAVLILYPVLLAGGLFLSTAFSHVLLMLFKAASAGFEGTFRAMAYSAAPMVLAVVPLLGSLAGALWGMVIMVVALKYLHQTTYTRIGLAFLVPLIILVLAAAVMTWPEFQARQTMY